MAIRAEKEKKARDRKTRMKVLEQHAAAAAVKSDQEIADIAKAATLRDLAQEKMDQNSDVVKLMTSMGARAIAFSVRDKQLYEKHDRDAVEIEYDRRMDILMEVDRLKDLHRREEEEVHKRAKRVEDKKTITEQIQMRHRSKLIAAEAREQENQGMRTLMKKYEEEDSRNAEIRKIEIEKSRLETIATNELAIRRKKEAKMAEKKEMEDILIYQALKDAELARREEEEAVADGIKKERQAKLLAQQERAQNNAGKLDELRARRAAEERERRARVAEREKAAKTKSDMEELLRSRAKQAADRKGMEERERLQADEEYRNALQYMQVMAEREEKETIAKHASSTKHREKLMAQIHSNEQRINRYYF